MTSDDSGKPMQTMHVERFYPFRENILDAYYFNAICSKRLVIIGERTINFNPPHKSFEEYMPRFDEEFKFFIKSNLNNNYLSNFKVS